MKKLISSMIRMIMVIMLVSIDILTTFTSAELFVEDENNGDNSVVEETGAVIQELNQLSGSVLEPLLEVVVNEDDNENETMEEGTGIVYEEIFVENNLVGSGDVLENNDEEETYLSEEDEEKIGNEEGDIFPVPNNLDIKDKIFDRFIQEEELCVTYDVKSDDTIKITGLNAAKAGCNVNLQIPSEIDGKVVNEIGEKAFYNKGVKLEGILIIPNTVETIGSNAFNEAFDKNKENYLEFEVGSILKSVGGKAFRGNNFIGELKLPGMLTGTISERAFSNNKFVGNLIIPKGVINIGEYAFYGNHFTGLDFSLTENLSVIQNNVFESMGTLEGKLVIPSTVISIGPNAFNESFNKSFDNSLEFEEGISLETINAYAFRGNNFCGELKLPNTVKGVIGDRAFSINNFSGILVIPSGVTKIGLSAFYGNKFTNIDFSAVENLGEIGSYAFYGMGTLEGKLVILSTVTSIGSFAFNETFNKNKENFLEFEDGSILETVDAYAFYGNNFIGELNLPGTLTGIIGEMAFSHNSFDGVLVIPSGVSEIVKSAFSWNKFDSVDFSEAENLRIIGSYAFYHMGTIEGELVIPKNVTLIGENVFDVNKISSVYFQSGGNVVIDNANAFCDNGGVVQGYANGATVNVTTENESCFHLNEKAQYNVTFETYGGGEVNSQSVYYYDTVEVPSLIPSKEGFKFKGWYLTGGESSYDFSTPVMQSFTLYAVYEEIKEAYLKKGSSFRSDLLSLSSADSIQQILRSENGPGEEITVTKNLAESGLPVIAWYENVGGTGTIYYHTEANVIKVNPDAYMMFNLSKLKKIDLELFDTSEVTNMESMFDGCKSLESLDLSNFDTSNVTTMKDMFWNCSSLTSLDLTSFDTSKVSSMRGMFYGDEKLETIIFGDDFHTSNVTTMQFMFQSCKILKNLESVNFDTSNVTNMNRMFESCGSLETASFVEGFRTNKVTDMGRMFLYDYKLKSLDLSGWNTSNVTDMNNMFSNCTSLESLNLSGWDTSKVTTMLYMFEKTKLKELDLSSFENYSLKTMEMMFISSSSLEKVYAGPHFVTNSVNNLGQMFDGCTSLNELDVSKRDTSNVTNMYRVFANCGSLKQLDVSKWNTSKTTTMMELFYKCNSLENLDVGGWKTDNVTNMESLFQENSKIKNFEVSGWNTSNVTNMSHMFRDCSSLESLDLTSFDTNKVININRMFDGLTKLKTIYVSDKFTTFSFTNSAEMFIRSPSIVGGNGTKYSSSRVNGSYAKVDTSTQSGYFTNPNSFTVRYLSGSNVVANLTGRLGGFATGLSDDRRSYNYYTDSTLLSGYDFTKPLSGYTEIYVSWVDKFKVIFDTDDGYPEIEGQYIKKGQTAVEPTVIPQKTGYLFTGWYISGTDTKFIFNTPITHDVTLVAHYDKQKYTITWNDDNGMLIDTTKVEYQGTPTHEDPEKQADGTYTYEFLKWNPEIKLATGNITYTAEYTPTYIDYEIKFNDYDGKFLSGALYHSGDNVIEPEHPERASTEQYTYIFTGWGEPILPVTGSKVYTAHYDEIINKYTITWIDGDGNTIYSGKVEWGEMPIYLGNIPTKQSTQDYNYIFNGNWLPEIKVVTGDAEYLAQFDEEYIKKDDGNHYSGGGRRTSSETSDDTHKSAEDEQERDNKEKQNQQDDEFKEQQYDIQQDDKEQDSNLNNYTQEQFDAYTFAKANMITTTSSIEKAKMNTSLKRIEMAKMLSYYAMNILGKEPDAEKGIIKFNDVTNNLDKQYDNGVTLAYQLGIMGINMKNNEFRPNDEVTRAEFVTALSRMLYNTEDGKGKIKYYEPHMAKIYNEGIITNTNPKMKEKRGYVMTMLMRATNGL